MYYETLDLKHFWQLSYYVLYNIMYPHVVVYLAMVGMCTRMLWCTWRWWACVLASCGVPGECGHVYQVPDLVDHVLCGVGLSAEPEYGQEHTGQLGKTRPHVAIGS